MLCMTPEQKAACKQRLCAIPMVQFFGAAMAPARMFSGGLMPSCCPGPNDANPADLLKPADSAEGAAARIKKMEAEAKARRAAVRYLGTVDCRRYPEAEAALVNALRGDTNECVRLEAALALGTCCCCTKKVIQALVETVTGRRTNDPAETSERVKAAASLALEKCLAKYHEETAPADRPPEPGRPEGTPPEPGKTARLAPEPYIEEARRALADRKAQLVQRALAREPAPATTAEPPTLPPDVGAQDEAATVQRTVAQINGSAPTAVAPQAQAQAQHDSAPVAELAPPTGKRDLWNIMRNAMRAR
jgi:hypothetical protein